MTGYILFSFYFTAYILFYLWPLILLRVLVPWVVRFVELPEAVVVVLQYLAAAAVLAGLALAWYRANMAARGQVAHSMTISEAHDYSGVYVTGLLSGIPVLRRLVRDGSDPNPDLRAR